MATTTWAPADHGPRGVAGPGVLPEHPALAGVSATAQGLDAPARRTGNHGLDLKQVPPSEEPGIGENVVRAFKDIAYAPHCPGNNLPGSFSPWPRAKPGMLNQVLTLTDCRRCGQH